MLEATSAEGFNQRWGRTEIPAPSHKSSLRHLFSQERVDPHSINLKQSANALVAPLERIVSTTNTRFADKIRSQNSSFPKRTFNSSYSRASALMIRLIELRNAGKGCHIPASITDDRSTHQPADVPASRSSAQAKTNKSSITASTTSAMQGQQGCTHAQILKKHTSSPNNPTWTARPDFDPETYGVEQRPPDPAFR
ncbi:uncharacterized protein M421DRAFT_195395 [Didymella exigua CBS 183.55]|uniref:Uncharacterized protein n=1 Tax=Didymella exigua CBS 183.55 TaxID=1150837 RepID=A0A6A5S4F9_9PLEO|nr:uncharacterized protein M421DRAFT_195395 [Didymella exigua CBS 183.55]KAF1933366.1 hypothetical protein M421DRAFT_195395 [Didymella exigua CBS 183.55]